MAKPTTEQAQEMIRLYEEGEKGAGRSECEGALISAISSGTTTTFGESTKLYSLVVGKTPTPNPLSLQVGMSTAY